MTVAQTHRETRAVFGTAGHIDHGKTSLVRVLTGIETDRLKEEKERGISIDLGFAYLDYDDGMRLGIVDVPGHERFIRTMLAGVHGIDFIVLVIAADDSIMPQTREHLDILTLLDVKAGLVALTKADLADEEMLLVVEAEVEDLVQGTFLQGAPIVRCSAVTGTGIDDLRRLVAEIAHTVPPRKRGPDLRLPVDRCFAMPGFGTVVTGTLIDGTARVGDSVVVLPRGLEGRIRGIQSHGSAVETLAAGTRTALNLSGLKVEDIERGDVVVAPKSLEPTEILDVSLVMLRSATRPLKHGARVRFYTGTTEAYGRVLLFEGKDLGPDQTALAQIRLDTPVMVRRDDRFVLRLYGPDITIGGGSVLDPAAHKRKRRELDATMENLHRIQSGNPQAIVAVKLTNATIGIRRADLPRMTGLSPAEVEAALPAMIDAGEIIGTSADEPLVHRDRVAALVGIVEAILAGHHDAQPFSPLGLPVHVLRQRLSDRLGESVGRDIFDRLIAHGRAGKKFQERRGTIVMAGRGLDLSAAQWQAREAIESALKTGGFTPPLPADVVAEAPVSKKIAGDLLRGLVDEGRLIDCGAQVIFHAEEFFAAIERVKQFLAANADAGLDLAACRELTGMSRKYAVPFLEKLDEMGITRRVGNVRFLAVPPAVPPAEPSN